MTVEIDEMTTRAPAGGVTVRLPVRLSTLEGRVPAWSMAYLTKVEEGYIYRFRLSMDRRTKLGDFTTRGGRHAISLNRGLPADLMLITYLHELAHLQAFIEQPRQEPPHGARWQRKFRQLLLGLCLEPGIPGPLRYALTQHAAHPRATLGADPALARLLEADKVMAQLYATRQAHLTQTPGPLATALLDMIPPGRAFRYRGRLFLMSGPLRRRHYATCLQSGKLFSFTTACRVDPVDPAERLRLTDLILAGELAPGDRFRHRGRHFTMLAKSGINQLACLDQDTGRTINLHRLMHVERQ